MRTDKQVHQLLEATPELVFELAGIPSPGECVYESVTLKEVEHRLDGVVRPLDATKPQWVVEVQFYADPWIYERLISELYRRRISLQRRDIEGIVFFAHRGLDVPQHPARTLVKAIYLDEALSQLAQREPEHPAVMAFAPLLNADREQVAEHFKAWYGTLQTSEALTPDQRKRYEQVFISWTMQRLGLKDESELAMLITDLPELEKTDFYRLVLERGEEKGEIKGELRGQAKALLHIGRTLWGPEPAHLAERLGQLEAAQLEKLMDSMNLSNWQEFEKMIPN